jgi:signal transduction histidine kinase
MGGSLSLVAGIAAQARRGHFIMLIMRTLIALLMTLAAAAVTAQVQTFEQASFQLAGTEAHSPPAPAAVRLPDNWSLQRQHAQGLGIYRIVWPMATVPGAQQALFIKRISMDAEVLVNGRLVRSSNGLREPYMRRWNHPWLVEVPNSFLVAGQNLIEVRVAALRDYNGGLSAIQAGDLVALQPEYERARFWQIDAAIFSFAVLLSMGVLSLLLGFRSGAQTYYSVAGAAAIAGALHNTDHFLLYVPFDWRVWALVVNAANVWFFVCIAIFLLRYARGQTSRIEVSMIGYGVVCMAALALWLWGPLTSELWALVWLPFFGFVSLYLLFESWTMAVAKRNFESVFVALAMTIFVALEIQGYLVQFRWLPFDRTYYSPLAGVLLAISLALMLVNQFFAALEDAARTNQELEARVAAKHAELDTSFTQLQGTVRANAALRERDRLLGEMHDGLGAQLIAGLKRAQSKRLTQEDMAQILRDCLTDLRLMVDSTAQTAEDLRSALGNLRYRFEQSLLDGSVELRWDLSELPEGYQLTPKATLNVLRIVQESLSNSLKYSKATWMGVSATQLSNGRIGLRITDNGVGFEEPSSLPGFGLNNMRRRAREMGGEVNVISGPAGTAVALTLPLPIDINNPVTLGQTTIGFNPATTTGTNG